MIKCNEGSVYIEGNAIQISSELVMLTSRILNVISEKTGTPIEDVERGHEQSMSFQKLIHSGMNPAEAASVVGVEIDEISRRKLEELNRQMKMNQDES